MIGGILTYNPRPVVFNTDSMERAKYVLPLLPLFFVFVLSRSCCMFYCCTNMLTLFFYSFIFEILEDNYADVVGYGRDQATLATPRTIPTPPELHNLRAMTHLLENGRFPVTLTARLQAQDIRPNFFLKSGKLGEMKLGDEKLGGALRLDFELLFLRRQTGVPIINESSLLACAASIWCARSHSASVGSHKERTSRRRSGPERTLPSGRLCR